MINPSYAVVIPTTGRPGLAELVATVDGDPAPTCIVVVDDQHAVVAHKAMLWPTTWLRTERSESAT